jgi:outer membrane protein TolC
MQTEPERDVLNSYDGATRSWSVGGTFSIPLDRAALRRDYQAAVITYRQAERDITRARDRVVRDVDAQLIVLRQLELAMEFQKRAISDAEKAARLAEFDYRRGRVTNRDVIEAQDRLLEAQNALQAALVAARIAQLRLLQFVGKLVADSEGRWLK